MLTPSDWSIVCVAPWNRAILTPGGIAKRLFRIPEGTPIEVLIALDALEPPQVSHEGQIVVVAKDRLIVRPKLCRFEEMDFSLELAARAIESLPETPITATGANIQYSSDAQIDCLADLLRSDFDDRCVDHDVEIKQRTLSRELLWEGQKVSVSITTTLAKTELKVNFELVTSNGREATEWLRTTAKDKLRTSSRLIESIVQIPKWDLKNESDRDQERNV